MEFTTKVENVNGRDVKTFAFGTGEKAKILASMKNVVKNAAGKIVQRKSKAAILPTDVPVVKSGFIQAYSEKDWATMKTTILGAANASANIAAQNVLRTDLEALITESELPTTSKPTAAKNVAEA